MVIEGVGCMGPSPLRGGSVCCFIITGGKSKRGGSFSEHYQRAHRALDSSWGPGKCRRKGAWRAGARRCSLGWLRYASEYESKISGLFSCLLEVQRCPKMKSSCYHARKGLVAGVREVCLSDNEWISKGSCHPRVGSTRDSQLWIAHQVRKR